MENNNFSSVWNTLSALNLLDPRTSKSITQDVDILSGASPEFLKFLVKIESMSDLKARALEAKNYIDLNNGIKEIDYHILGEYLANPSVVPLDIWRKLYVLERSIPPRFGNKYTWFDRLKVFQNTFVREDAVAGKAIYKNKKIYFKKGSSNNPTNHDRLVYGNGKWGADFYFYDDSLPGSTTREKMVSVEMKHSKLDLESAIKKYKNDKYLYNARYLILAMADGTYYMVNYNTEPEEVTKLNIFCEDPFYID